jgi:hypothetical protein
MEILSHPAEVRAPPSGQLGQDRQMDYRGDAVQLGGVEQGSGGCRKSLPGPPKRAAILLLKSVLLT